MKFSLCKISYFNMRTLLTFFAIALLSFTTKGQYPFEKYPAIKYQEYKDWKYYDKSEKENRTHCTMTIPNFFDNQDSLTVQLTNFDQSDSSFIRIYRNKTLLQKKFEAMFFSEMNIGMESIKVADINGDSLKDIKLVAWYMGNGTAAMNVRTVYLFQNPNNHFTKISFDDKIGNDRPERDFDGDGNFEIITMTLKGYEEHSYWLFNLFNYHNGELISANSKDNYPIMIQFLFRANYEITNNVSMEEMKELGMKLPEGYDKN